MALVFRVAAGTDIGLGHLMRCLALAHSANEEGIPVRFILNAAATQLARQRHDWVGAIEVMPDGLSETDELDWLAARVEPTDVLILDGYQFGQDYRVRCRQMSAKLVCFDDANLTINLHADLVINSSQAAQKGFYQQYAPDAQLCLGPDYQLLRRDFWLIPDVPLLQRPSLTIMMGGSDTANITLPLLKALTIRQAPMPIRVITGAAYPHLTALQAWLADTELQVQHIHNCQQMADVLVYSKLAVAAAGATQFELFACQTPALLVTVADNQHASTQAATAQGLCWSEDSRQTNIDRLAERVCHLWHQNEQLALCHERLKQMNLAAGNTRVLAQIMALAYE